MALWPPRNYDKRPVISVPGDSAVWVGRDAWVEVARHAFSSASRPVIVVDTYPGVELAELIKEIHRSLPDFEVVDVEAEAAKSAQERDRLLAHHITEDRVFGIISHHVLADLYDSERLAALGDCVSSMSRPVVLVGWGAALVPARAATTVLVDMPRWEIQRRQRKGAPSWRVDNHAEDAIRKFKRGYFVEWRIADRHKRRLFRTADYVMEANGPASEVKMIAAATFQEAMTTAVTGPFRVVPYFDPGVWGGQWMKEVCGLDPDSENFAWCFDCVPEENSILLEVAGHQLEFPAIDVVFERPVDLLGEDTFSRFGAEFPIRFDFLDTMGGGNLSLQVHPLTDYIRDRFGASYTQDESYYLMDATGDAAVYLGLRDDVDPDEMVDALMVAERGEAEFPVDRFVNRFPAAKHDHFSIPAGTVHCSGADSMVLEISATPYIFTFKMWDWGRVGLDGTPRPIHIEHAANSIQWDRKTDWTRENLVGRVECIAEGPGWIEERTGLHSLEFIEVRRHWFTGAVPHDTGGTVNVLNLVEGEAAVVESPTGAFAPFVVHYAETFIVPAGVGAYSIRPQSSDPSAPLATVKAFVRGTMRTTARPC